MGITFNFSFSFFLLTNLMFNVYFGSSFINNKYYFQRNKKGANPSTLLLSNLPVQVSDKDGSFSLSCLYKAIYTGLSVAQKQSNNITESWTTSQKSYTFHRILINMSSLNYFSTETTSLQSTLKS